MKRELLLKIEVTETSAQMNLQDLLNVTAESILNPANLSPNPQSLKVRLVREWVYDGTFGHSRYEPKFQKKTCYTLILFLTSLVPLKAVTKIPEEILWVKPRPQITL